MWAPVGLAVTPAPPASSSWPLNPGIAAGAGVAGAGQPDVRAVDQDADLVADSRHSTYWPSSGTVKLFFPPVRIGTCSLLLTPSAGSLSIAAGERVQGGEAPPLICGDHARAHASKRARVA